MRQKVRGALVRAASAIVTFVAMGCGGSTQDPLPPDPCQVAHDLRVSPAFLTLAQEADIAARAIPGGFGGMFQDRGQGEDVGHLVVFLKDLSDADESRVALMQLLACNGAYPGWAGERVTFQNIEFRQGKYDGSELLAFLRALTSVREDPEVWAVEEDPETNRIWIGLNSALARPRVEAAVNAAGVPLAAVDIESPPEGPALQSFEVLNMPAIDDGNSPGDGIFSFVLRVRFTNLFSTPRYPDWCLSPDWDSFTRYFLHTIEKWDGVAWREVFRPICNLVLFPPREILAGEAQTDSVPVSASRRIMTVPVWRTARLSGTYRFVGKVYRSMTSVPPFLEDLAPVSEQTSTPFRIISSLP